LTGEHFIPTEETLNIYPNKGLNYFDYTGDDPKLYFGRGKETERLLNVLEKVFQESQKSSDKQLIMICC